MRINEDGYFMLRKVCGSESDGTKRHILSWIENKYPCRAIGETTCMG